MKAPLLLLIFLLAIIFSSSVLIAFSALPVQAKKDYGGMNPSITPRYYPAPRPPIQVKIDLEPADYHYMRLNSTNYFSLTYFLGGAIQFSKYSGTPTTIVLDGQSQLNISSESSQSNSEEKWCFDSNCSGPMILFHANNVSLATYYYYDLQFVRVSDEVLGGGAINVSASYTQPGAFLNPAFVTNETPSFASLFVNLSPTPFGIWNPRSAAASPALAVSSGANERWYLANSTTILSPPSSIIAYHHQFYARIGSTDPLCGTVSPASGWLSVDQPQKLGVTLSPNCVLEEWIGSGSGSYTGTNGSATIMVKGPINETAVIVASSSSTSSTSSSPSSSSTSSVVTSSTSTVQSTNSTSSANPGGSLRSSRNLIILSLIIEIIVAVLVASYLVLRRKRPIGKTG